MSQLGELLERFRPTAADLEAELRPLLAALDEVEDVELVARMGRMAAPPPP